jgi:hypothetical protein
VTNVFVSYAGENRKEVEHLVADMELMGHVVWVDRDITGGAAWWQEVLEHIRQSDVVVFALSADSLASDACRRECYYAHSLRRAVIPVEVSQSVSRQLLPPDLQQLQVVSYVQESKAEFAHIARAIASAPRAPLPNPLPRPPDVPVSYLMRIQNRLNDPRPMSLADQDMIVDWLERGVRRADEHREAHALLVRMQGRRGIDPLVAARITTVLGTAQPTPPGPTARPMKVNPPAPVATSLRGWRTPMYTFIIVCTLVIPLVGFIVGFTNMRFKERRGQAIALILIGLVNVGVLYLASTSVEGS